MAARESPDSGAVEDSDMISIPHQPEARRLSSKGVRVYSRDGSKIITLPANRAVQDSANAIEHVVDDGYDSDGIKFVAGDNIDFEYGSPPPPPAVAADGNALTDEASKKNKKKKKKKRSKGLLDNSPQSIQLHNDGNGVTINNVDLSSPNVLADVAAVAANSIGESRNSDSLKSGSKKKKKSDKDKIWDTSNEEERQRIKQFWSSLSEDDRRNLIKIEKETVLLKMKEQQQHSCSCSVCGRKRLAIEEELEFLYDTYYSELDVYADNNGFPQTLQFTGSGLPPLPPPPPQKNGQSAISLSAEYYSEYEEDEEEDEEDEGEYSDYGDEEEEYENSTPHDCYHSGHYHDHYNHTRGESHAHNHGHEHNHDHHDQDHDHSHDHSDVHRHSHNHEHNHEPIQDQHSLDLHSQGHERDNHGHAHSRAPHSHVHDHLGDIEHDHNSSFDLFNFGNSLSMNGGILTVADDLLKNDGKKFIDMMEQLAERRMARDQEAFANGRAVRYYDAEYDQDENADKIVEEEDGDYDVEPYDDEYDENEESRVLGSDEGYEDEYEEEEEEYEEDGVTTEQRIAEGRRMLQIIAARMFEQRVLAAYKESVAKERQQKLLEELEEEERRKEEREQKKLKDKEKKKDKKRALKQAKEEERARKEAERLQQEAALKAEQEKKNEEKRKKQMELKAKKEAEKKKKEEEERRRKQEEERRREERKRKEREEQEARRLQKELELKRKEEEKRRIEEKRREEELEKQESAKLEEELKRQQEEEALAAQRALEAQKMRQIQKRELLQELQRRTVSSPPSSVPSPQDKTAGMVGFSNGAYPAQIPQQQAPTPATYGGGAMSGQHVNGSSGFLGMPSMTQQMHLPPFGLSPASPQNQPQKSLNHGPPSFSGVPMNTLNANNTPSTLRSSEFEMDDNPIDELNRIMGSSVLIPDDEEPDLLNEIQNSSAPKQPLVANRYAYRTPSQTTFASQPPQAAFAGQTSQTAFPSQVPSQTAFAVQPPTQSAFTGLNPLFGASPSLKQPPLTANTTPVNGSAAGTSMWATNSASTASSLWGPTSSAPAATPVAASDQTLRTAIRAYSALSKEGWATPDGYIPASILYQTTMKLQGNDYGMNQTEFHNACGVFDAMLPERFESRRDNVGIVTHLKYCPSQSMHVSKERLWPIGITGVL